MQKKNAYTMNKDAYLRYCIIDECLHNSPRGWTVIELMKKIEEGLSERYPNRAAITRCIAMPIHHVVFMIRGCLLISERTCKQHVISCTHIEVYPNLIGFQIQLLIWRFIPKTHLVHPLSLNLIAIPKEWTFCRPFTKP